jgi:gluconate 5-dehydrogenase
MTAPLAEDPQRLERMAARTLLGRLGDPARDLAGAVVWLVSDAAAYVTGQLIYVDGGWTAW